MPINIKCIKVKFLGFWPSFSDNDNFILDILKSRYEVLVSDNPDYLFYSVFSDEYLQYDCVRIFFTGENIIPDFNLCDYASGYQWLTFEDRYCRFPSYLIPKYGDWEYAKWIEMASKKHLNNENLLQEKTKFCSFVYSNPNADGIREELFNKLSDYKEVAAGGRFLNNTETGLPVEDKISFECQCKFSIVVENGEGVGYTTEKIISAFAAKTVPIYWGNPAVGREINTKSFVNCYDYHAIEDVISAVEQIDQNDELYLAMVSSPAFKSNFDCLNALNEFRDFLYTIMDKPLYEAKYRNNVCWGGAYEKKMQFCAKQYQRYTARWNKLSDIYQFLKKVPLVKVLTAKVKKELIRKYAPNRGSN